MRTSKKGLELLYEILTQPVFNQESLDKIKNLARIRYKEFCESPGSIAHNLIYKHVYKGHPYSKSSIPDDRVIDAITCQDLKQFHKRVISAEGAIVSVVGDFDESKFLKAVNNLMQKIEVHKVDSLEYPEINTIKPTVLTHAINRDQITLCFAGLSVNRLHLDYDKLVIFDHIFAQGMHSRLFNLRVKYGLFYTIHGSLVTGADEQPGIIQIKTIVTPDNVQLAEQLINQTIDNVIDSITEQEVEQAKQVVLNDPINAYATNSSIASTFIFLNKFKLPYDYFNQRIETIKTITIDDVKQAARKILSRDKLITVKVGRV